MTKLIDKVKATLKDAAKKLSGNKKRKFEAKTTIDLFERNARKAERELGWGRKTIEKGIKELESGITCVDNYKGRGRKKTEERLPKIEEDIKSLVEPKSQADPDFKGTFAYTKLTAAKVRKALIEEKGYTEEELPCENTIGNILDRMNYKLRRVQKAKPLKKIPEVDEIFENVEDANRKADEDNETLRISIDSKAKVKIGEFSRNGKSRGEKAKKAADHDMSSDAVLVPFGILDVLSGCLTIYFGTSAETSDFIIDCLQLWWNDNKDKYVHIKTIAINLDNGPQVESHRTQFIKRIVEFAEQTGLKIRLIYYPPYHSKYNSIERCWGILENNWNGEILNSVEKALEWAGTMTWKGLKPAIVLIDKIYKKGISLTKKG
jgi:transposase